MNGMYLNNPDFDFAELEFPIRTLHDDIPTKFKNEQLLKQGVEFEKYIKKNDQTLSAADPEFIFDFLEEALEDAKKLEAQ